MLRVEQNRTTGRKSDRVDCVSNTATLCAPRQVVIGLSDEEGKVEGICGTLVTDVKFIRYASGKQFTWKI